LTPELSDVELAQEHSLRLRAIRAGGAASFRRLT
jgi:hypothetical protein